ncbi:MAG TPA: nucleoside-diphosphate kinase, partial [Candidatus Saccharimonadales bacterium]
MSSNVQKTLVLFKPDTVQRGLVGEILTRFERVGLKIVATKMIAPDKEHYFQHYEGIGQMVTRRGEQAFNVTLDMMTSGPVVAMVFEGVEAVALVRKLVGPTEPKSA